MTRMSDEQMDPMDVQLGMLSKIEELESTNKRSLKAAKDLAAMNLDLAEDNKRLRDLLKDFVDADKGFQNSDTTFDKQLVAARAALERKE